MKIRLLFLVLASSLSACVSLPKEVENPLNGLCLNLMTSQYLLSVRRDLYTSDRLMTEKSEYGRHSSLKGQVSSGTNVVVHRVLEAKDGSWGRFLRVQVEINEGEFKGVIADVPVHAPYHPSGKWTKNFTLDPNALEFNEEIVVPCD